MPPLIRAEDWELAGDEVSVPYMKEYTTYFDDLVAKVEADKVQWVGRDLVPFSRFALDVFCSMHPEMVKRLLDGTVARVMKSPT